MRERKKKKEKGSKIRCSDVIYRNFIRINGVRGEKKKKEKRETAVFNLL